MNYKLLNFNIHGDNRISQISRGTFTRSFIFKDYAEAYRGAVHCASLVTGKPGILLLEGADFLQEAQVMRDTEDNVLTYKTTSPDIIHLCGQNTDVDFLTDCIIRLEDCVRSYGSRLCAFVIDPLMFSLGMSPVPKAYLEAARVFCDKYGMMLIFDESKCGLARSGSWFAYEAAGVVPDILISSVALESGNVYLLSLTEKTALKCEVPESLADENLCNQVESFIHSAEQNNLLFENTGGGYSTAKEICDASALLVKPRGRGLIAAFDVEAAALHDVRYFCWKLGNLFVRAKMPFLLAREGYSFCLLLDYGIKHGALDDIKKEITTIVQGELMGSE